MSRRQDLRIFSRKKAQMTQKGTGEPQGSIFWILNSRILYSLRCPSPDSWLLYLLTPFLAAASPLSAH